MRHFYQSKNSRVYFININVFCLVVYTNYLHLAIVFIPFATSYIPAYIYTEEREGISGNPTERDTTKGKPESLPAYSERDEQLKMHNPK